VVFFNDIYACMNVFRMEFRGRIGLDVFCVWYFGVALRLSVYEKSVLSDDVSVVGR
jgi:hypothetical protein